jgi:hypothetical protein
MYLGLCLISVIAVVWAITAMPTRPKVETVRPRDLERRDAQLRACPDRVTKADLDRALRAYPLSEPTIARVLGTAAERGISARTMWCWADRFGVDKLVLALDADVAERRLKRHLDAGTTPDWAAMTVFAGLNNDNRTGAMPIDEILDLDSVPDSDELRFDLSEWETPDLPAVATTDVDLSQFNHLPPIFNPGLPVTRSAKPPADQTSGQRAGGDDNWPQVA